MNGSVSNNGARAAALMTEVARVAGVAPSTVSRVLNGRNKENRPSSRRRAQHIRTLAESLGYRPNAAARAISTGRFGCVALLMSSDRRYSYLPAGLLDGICSALTQRDLHLTIAQLPDEQLTSEGHVPKILRQCLADGLLINYHYHIPARMMELIRQHQIPSVWINVRLRADCVCPDDFGAGRRAVEHLLGLGHRRIAYVDYSHGWRDIETAHYSARERCAGYEQALRQAGLTPWVIRGDGPNVPPEQREAASAEWLRQPTRPTAAVCYSASAMVAPITVAATKLGILVPRDLSIVGFGDEPSLAAGVPVTMLGLPQRAIAREGVAMLLEKIDQPARLFEPRQIALRLFPGATCAAAGPAQ